MKERERAIMNQGVKGEEWGVKGEKRNNQCVEELPAN